jgi:hypothetical protein
MMRGINRNYQCESDSDSDHFIYRHENEPDNCGSDNYDSDNHDLDNHDSDNHDSDNYDSDNYDRDNYDRDNYDEDGYDNYGYDRNGYDVDGYNRYGFNCRKFHINGTRYDDDGYNSNGFNRNGFNRNGFNRNGFNRYGFNRREFHINGTRYDDDGYDYYGYDHNGYNRAGFNYQQIHRNGTRFDEDGFDEDGFDIDGYDIEEYDREGYDRERFHRDGYNREGYDRERFDRSGYDIQGYDRDGYNRFGFNKQKIHKNQTIYDENGYDNDGFNSQGYDIDGYNIDGYNMEGFNIEGIYLDGTLYNSLGFNYRGYDIDGFNYSGYNCAGYDRDGYNRERFHRDGYNREGYNKHGYDRNGYDINGFDRCDIDIEGYHRDGYNQRGYNRQGIYNPNYIYERSRREVIEAQNFLMRREAELQVSKFKILKLTNLSDNVLYFNLGRIENYPLTQIHICGANVSMHDSTATHVHREFNKEKKQFKKLYYLLGNFDKEPKTDNSLSLFTEIQRLFTDKLYNIKKNIPDYDIKISIVIKSLKNLLSKLYNLLLKPKKDWVSAAYCYQSRRILMEAICDYSTKPEKILPILRTCDLYLRYIKNLCLLNDELFINIIIEYAKSNLEAYQKHEGVATLADINGFFDMPRDLSCDQGWIERLILCPNVFIKTKQLIEKNALQLFEGSSMYKLVDYLIKDLKIPIKIEEINFQCLIKEFKVSPENSNIKGDIEEKKKILIDKIYSFICKKLNKEGYDIEPIQVKIQEYVEEFINSDVDESSIEIDKYKKKYTK